MKTVQDIKIAIKKLTPKQFAKLRDWFWELDNDRWDREMERDAAAGKFDAMIRQVDKDIKAGRVRDFP